MKKLFLILSILIATGISYAQTNRDTLRLNFPIVIDPAGKDSLCEVLEFPEYGDIHFRFDNYRYIVIKDSILSANFEVVFHYGDENPLSEFKDGKYYFNGIMIWVYRRDYKYIYRKINAMLFHNELDHTDISHHDVPDPDNELLFCFDEEEAYFFIQHFKE